MDEEELTFDAAVWRLRSCETPPGKAKGKTWYDVAYAMLREIERLQQYLPPEQRSFDPQKGLTEEERIDMYYESVQTDPGYTICSMTNKRSYSSEAMAIRRSAKAGHKMRAYLCEWCRGYHATKAPHL